MRKPKAAPLPALPPGIQAGDLKFPMYKSAYLQDLGNGYEQRVQFDMWNTTAFGWCIPTLGIKAVSRRAYAAGVTTARTYATRVSDGAVVRIGFGPHVVGKVTVYVRKGRAKALKAYVDMWLKGQGDAGAVRDRISSRRAQTELRRFGRGW